MRDVNTAQTYTRQPDSGQIANTYVSVDDGISFAVNKNPSVHVGQTERASSIDRESGSITTQIVSNAPQVTVRCTLAVREVRLSLAWEA